MKAHRCTALTDGWCGWCEDAAERIADARDEPREFDDRALWSYTPDYGDAMTRGGW